MTTSTTEAGRVPASLHTEKTRAYGMWICRLVTADGRQFEGSGWSQQLAEYRARSRAQEETK